MYDRRMPFKDAKKARAAHRIYNKRWYQKYSAEIIEKRTRRQRAIVAFVRSQKVACKCGESHPACLDFHHRDSSAKSVSLANVAKMGWSLARVKKEIEKCDVTCSNCHRKLHWKVPSGSTADSAPVSEAGGREFKSHPDDHVGARSTGRTPDCESGDQGSKPGTHPISRRGRAEIAPVF